MDQQLAAEAALPALIACNMAIVNSAPTKRPFWAISAKPYLRAIVDNNYGMEDPTMCVLYALNNLHQWRGEEARQVKKMLNKSIA
jgi:hypothetical protein